MTTEIRTIANALNAFVVLMLVAAMFPFWRYDFYVVLRWVVFLICLLHAFAATTAKRSAALMIFVLIGVLFNPIFPIYLTRGLWFWIDVICAIFMRVGYEDLVSVQERT